VRKAAGKVRITGQLIDAVTGAHIWADRFERDLMDVFALQDEVTVAVVSAIQPKLLQTEIAMATQAPRYLILLDDGLYVSLGNLRSFEERSKTEVARWEKEKALCVPKT
jgi:hypothetical protein